MPLYRNIHTKTPDSEDINDMPDDFHRLFYIMFFIILDSAGRGYDKPAWLKSKAFPLREDVTYEQINAAMDWFEKRGMIHRYEVDGKKCFWDPKFEAHQHGLNKEGKSVIPAPTPEQVRSWSGVTPEQVGSNSGATPSRVEANQNMGRSNSGPKTKTKTKTKAKTNTDSNTKAFARAEKIESVDDLEPPLENILEPAQKPALTPGDALAIPRTKQLQMWNFVTGELQRDMSKVDFDTWIRPLTCKGMSGRQFKIGAVNSFAQEWVESRVSAQIERVLSGQAGFEVEVIIVVDHEPDPVESPAFALKNRKDAQCVIASRG